MFCFYSFWTDIFLLEAPIKMKWKQRSIEERKKILKHELMIEFDES